MNILVTGANGLLGKELVHKLSERYNVFAVVNHSNSLEFSKSTRIRIIHHDLAKPDFSELPKEIDMIYYLAQSNEFRNFPEGYDDMLRVNIYSPLKLISWGLDNQVKKFVYASSGGVYKNPVEPVKEFFGINANMKNGFYLDSKLAAEILLRNFSSYFNTFIIARPFFIYGQKQKPSMLIPRLIDNIKNNNPIFLTSEEGLRINPIHVDDASIAFEKMIQLEGDHLINIAGDEIVSIKSLSDNIAHKLKIKPIYEFHPQKQFDLIADNSLMKSLLHKPKTNLDDGLNEFIQ